jgi:hypothetical protein
MIPGEELYEKAKLLSGAGIGVVWAQERSCRRVVRMSVIITGAELQVSLRRIF